MAMDDITVKQLLAENEEALSFLIKVMSMQLNEMMIETRTFGTPEQKQAIERMLRNALEKLKE